MHRLVLAFRIFFKVLFDAAMAARIEPLLSSTPATPPVEPRPPEPKAPEPKSSKPPASAKASSRSEALDLLAALQREARFVDFVKEDLAAYSDAQIAAAVRDVHRDCRSVVERVFAPVPVVEAAEGSELSVPTGNEAAAFKLVGQVVGQPPFRGKLCHHGWKATRSELPAWTGSAEAARIIAPAEVEVAG
jgi:hypothetical protein